MLQKRSSLLRRIVNIIALSKELTGKYKLWGHYFKKACSSNWALSVFHSSLQSIIHIPVVFLFVCFLKIVLPFKGKKTINLFTLVPTTHLVPNEYCTTFIQFPSPHFQVISLNTPHIHFISVLFSLHFHSNTTYLYLLFSQIPTLSPLSWNLAFHP